MKPKKNIGGWQTKVEIYKDHVIKTPKTEKEIKPLVLNYLTYLGKPHQLDKTVKKAIKDIKKSIKIIEKSKIPKRHLAYPEFLKNGQIKQKKAICMDEKIKDLQKKKKINEVKKIIDKFLKFIHKLWEYGIHEKPLKFDKNFGVIKNKIVLIDLFELSSNKEKVKKRIRKKSWHKRESYRRSFSKEIVEYYLQKADKELTIEKLNRYWKKRIK